MDLCDGCGAEVVRMPVRLGDVPAMSVTFWSIPTAFERLMVLVDGSYGIREHRCRDYRAWHRPADQRDVNTLDVADGWRPEREAVPA
jgi:hypothetical protein